MDYKSHSPKIPKNHRIAMIGDKRSIGQMEQCGVYGKHGHSSDGFFKVISYPKWWSEKGRQERAKTKATNVETKRGPISGLNNEQYQQFQNIFTQWNGSVEECVQIIAKKTGKENHCSDWVIDSGATEHIIDRADYIESKIETTHELPVTILNGDCILVEGKGVCNLPSGLWI